MNINGALFTFQVKVVWLHTQSTALPTVLHLQELCDIIDYYSVLLTRTWPSRTSSRTAL